MHRQHILLWDRSMALLCKHIKVGWVARAVQHHRSPRLRGDLVSTGFHRHRALAEKLESSPRPRVGMTLAIAAHSRLLVQTPSR